MRNIEIETQDPLSEMIKRGFSMKEVMDEDSEALLKFKITASLITEFGEKLGALSILAGADTTFLSQKTAATDTRNGYRYLLNDKAQLIRQICIAYYGENDTLVRSLGLSKLNNLTSMEFLLKIIASEKVVADNLDQLTEETGIDQSDLDDLIILRQNMQEAHRLRTQAVLKRSHATTERKQLKAEVLLLMRKYSRLGKTYWLRVGNGEKAAKYLLTKDYE